MAPVLDAADPLRERLLRDELLRDVTADDLLIVATQDCDLVCQSFETEPYAEIVIGRRVDTADGNCRFDLIPAGSRSIRGSRDHRRLLDRRDRGVPRYSASSSQRRL